MTRVVILLLLLVLWRPVLGSEADSVTPAEKLFALHVQTLLAQRCHACHGADPKAIESDLDLTTRAGMLRGGQITATALVPGDAAASPLYLMLKEGNEWDIVMPPKHTDRLTEQEQWYIRDWINGGAPWPAPERVNQIRELFRDDLGVPVATSGGLSDDWTNRRYKPEDLWAWQPLTSPAPPESRSEHIVDRFIDARLAEMGLEPALRADRTTLLRRASYDVIGLPPTPEELADFCNDPASDRDAFARVVERLLASPHYGEQYARHWLDVSRYADSAGFANDYERPTAWRYRDYVVRSFNADKPYDHFVLEQLAGDEIDATNPELLVAVGYLRMGPWEHTGMSVAKVTRQQFLDDITDAVGQTFLAQPLQCARCHDHKFDPIPTRDYYSVQAVFSTTQFADRQAAFLPCEADAAKSPDAGYLKQRIAHYEALKDTVKPGASAKDNGLDRIAKKYLERHRGELDRFSPYALSVYTGPTPPAKPVYGRRMEMPKDPMNVKAAEVEKTAILAGGDPFSPTQAVTPGILSAVGVSADISKSVENRRLSFAQWVVHPDNPLTARVMANRVWQWHFGRGLADTPNNFGATGKKPTHPELLDYLACSLRDSGWSVKALHRLILTSDAYARANQHPDPAAVESKDPLGTGYAVFRMRRLAAEELRDAMLAVSGELNPAIGGPPVRPDMNVEAALQPRQIMGSYAPAWQASPLRSDRHRRNLYALKLRGQRDPFLETFNQPSPETPCQQRETSIVTPQALTLLNSPEIQERAVALATRVVRDCKVSADQPAPAAVIERLFLLAYGRQPTFEEQNACQEHWTVMTERHTTMSIPRSQPAAEVTRRAVDELSGEEFDFTEILEQSADYQPDRQWADVSARMRGLAEVCLIVLNSNEFVYVP